MRKTPVVAVAATFPHPKSSMTPVSADEEAEEAKVRDRVRKVRRKTTHDLYAVLQLWGFWGSEGRKET
jgi:hypothetical protein